MNMHLHETKYSAIKNSIFFRGFQRVWSIVNENYTFFLEKLNFLHLVSYQKLVSKDWYIQFHKNKNKQ